MTERELVLLETENILRRLPRPLKKPRHIPNTSTRALREAGMTERDAQILAEGAAHDAAYVRDVNAAARLTPDRELPPRVADALGVLQEQVGSGAVSDAGMMPSTQSLTMPPNTPGWTAEGDNPSVYTHAAHGTVRLHGDRWTHHAAGGRIVKSGTTQEGLAAYMKSLKGEVGGSSEALDDVLRRVRGQSPVMPAGLHTRLHEALVRTAERVPSGGDLHERLRKAVTR